LSDELAPEYFEERRWSEMFFNLANSKRSGKRVGIDLLGALAEIVNIDARDYSFPYSGETALCHSVRNGRVDHLKLLLKHGANIDAANDLSLTPLMLATRGRQFNCVEFLLTHKADPNLKAQQRWTALHYAVREGVRLVEILVNHKAEIDATTNDFSTPLMLAVRFNTDCVDFLLEQGANFNMADKDGCTALDIARKTPCLRLHALSLQNYQLKEKSAHLESMILQSAEMSEKQLKKISAHFESEISQLKTELQTAHEKINRASCVFGIFIILISFFVFWKSM